MARHGNTRSPSPVGSSYSSKRSRRDDDRYEKSRRDDGRSYKRRSRTRSPDVSDPYIQLEGMKLTDLTCRGDIEIETRVRTVTVQEIDMRWTPIAQAIETALERGEDQGIAS